MKNVIIIGGGGFGREVQWLVERVNQREKVWNILGYIDDGIEKGSMVDGYSVLGGIDCLHEYSGKTAVVCAIGAASTRKKVIEKVKQIGDFEFPNLIDPSVVMSERIDMGEGNIICAGNILTVDIEIGDFNIINLDCTVGHDVVIESFVTVYPSVNVSGCVLVGENTELGTGSQVIQGISIGRDVIIGAGAVVVSDIQKAGTYIGIPAKKMEKERA